MKSLCKVIITSKKLRILLAIALALIAAGALSQSDAVFDCTQLDEFRRLGTALYPVEITWYSANCVEEEEEVIFWPPLPTPTPRPPVNTCGELPADIVVSGHREFSTQCQRLSAAGVGNASLVAMGILDAVDVWANVDSEIRVCFRKQGSLKFLDAATAPRLVSDLAAEYTDGMTCGRINRVGTVVLLPGSVPAQQTEGAQSLLASTNPPSSTSCELETTGHLSLRAGPSVQYARLLLMPEGRDLLARARIGDWFMVNFEGQWGWASGEYLETSPGCDALDDERAIILPPIIASSAPESEQAMTDEAETMPDAEDAETDERPSPSVCQLTAVYLLNLRAGPSLDYDVLTEVPYQSRLIASAKSGEWFKVDYEGVAGWVNREYVFRWGACYALGEDEAMMPLASEEPGAPEAEVSMVEDEETMPDAEEAETDEGPSPSVCQLTAVYLLNLRAGPGLEYDVLAEVPYQSRLIASAKSGDWFKVDYEGVAGWVNREYVFRWGSCYALGEADAMMPRASTEPPVSEVVEAGEMAETGALEIAADARALTHCNLRSGDIINLRQGPGPEYAVIAEIPFRTSMNALARSGDWFMVRYQTDTGWVSIDYVFRNGACG